MHARFIVVVGVVVGLVGCGSPAPEQEATDTVAPVFEMTDSERQYALFEAQRVADENARRRREAREAGGWQQLRAGRPQQQSPSRTGTLSDRMEEAMAQTEIQTCYAFIRQSLAGTGSTARFRSFLDGAGMQHLGGGKLFLRSFAYITRADGSTVEMHYDCTAEDGAVTEFTVQ